jgi:hypothetical protein
MQRSCFLYFLLKRFSKMLQYYNAEETKSQGFSRNFFSRRCIFSLLDGTPGWRKTILPQADHRRFSANIIRLGIVF